MSETAEIMRRLRALRKGRKISSVAASRLTGHGDLYIKCIEARTIVGGRDITLSTLLTYCRAIGVRLCYEPVDDSREVPHG